MKRLIALPLALLAISVAFAQSDSPLRLVLSQDLVTTVQQDGKTVERLTPSPASVATGAILRQEASATNVSRKALRRVVIAVPVPKQTTFAGSATSATNRWSVQYSFDGGKTFGTEPLKETLEVTENGQKVKREVTVSPTRYTNVRWTVATLNPDETLKFAFRVKVK